MVSKIEKWQAKNDELFLLIRILKYLGSFLVI